MTKKEQRRLQVEANNLIRANQKIERDRQKLLAKEASAKKLADKKAATAERLRLKNEATQKRIADRKAAWAESALKKAQEKIDAMVKKEIDNERLFMDRMDQEFRYFRFLKHKIEELIKRGESNKFIIDAVFYNVRNAPFEIGCTPLFNLKFMPKPAIDGLVIRTRIAPSAKPSSDSSLCSILSDPRTSTASGISRAR